MEFDSIGTVGSQIYLFRGFYIPSICLNNIVCFSIKCRIASIFVDIVFIAETLTVGAVLIFSIKTSIEISGCDFGVLEKLLILLDKVLDIHSFRQKILCRVTCKEGLCLHCLWRDGNLARCNGKDGGIFEPAIAI